MSDVDIPEAPFVGRSFRDPQAFLREPGLPAPLLCPRRNA